MAEAPTFVERKDLYIGRRVGSVPEPRDDRGDRGRHRAAARPRARRVARRHRPRRRRRAPRLRHGPLPRLDAGRARRRDLASLEGAAGARAEDRRDDLARERLPGAAVDGRAGLLRRRWCSTSTPTSRASFTFVEERAGAIGNRVRVRRAPVGVVAAVIPWNVPLFVVGAEARPGARGGLHGGAEARARDAARRLSAGRGDPRGRAAARRRQRALRGPREQRVPGPPPGHRQGRASRAAPSTGGKIGGICGEQIKRCTLELGGKSAAILLEDVDLAATHAAACSARRC